MIQLFRRFFSSKIGLGITLAFLGLIALAFASMDVSGTATFGGVSGGDRVAVVGDEKIGTADLNRRAQNALQGIRQENPTLSMQAFVEQGGLDGVLERMIDRFAITGYADEYGIRAGDNLVNSEILQIPAFRGPDGSFSQEVYQAALNQQSLTDAMLRDDLRTSLIERQIMQSATAGTAIPTKLARNYAALLRERREGSIALIPSAVFAPEGDPSNAQLQAFYEENRSRYIRPERRTIRYASFGIGAIDASVAPTPADIAARYERDAEQYAAKESRTITQLIVPTEDAANAIRQRVSGGASLEAVAREAGFSTSSVGPVERGELADSASPQVAAAAFAAPRGSIATPARSGLGWHVVRVDGIESTPAQTLAQATPSIREALLVEKRNEALADLSSRVEEQIDGGAPLSEVAEELGIEVNTSPPLTADGRVYGEQGRGAPEQLQDAVSVAFQMDEGEPQLAEIVRGETFLIFEAADITPSATAPLNEIREQVITQWRLAEGARLAREAADRVMERLGEDTTLAAAVRQEEERLPPVDSINLTREQLAQRQQRVPAPLALLFSMAQGTAKRLEAPNDLGWFVVDLDEISTDEVAADDPIVVATRQQLGDTLAQEYSSQLVAAMREELGVEKNESAIEAVRKQLLGES
ncbi:peptidyl-prolyl cis-trans isomerase D [Altererythrobacter xiamenensis]|uniref:Parvulin-like PPIase n=1 Tax=Altererythrobacter xiamenensis TaxID=1316679 RepID=A0A1Y6FI91_9SPHN|nr:peptidylprolyl isomerase [Altererythrobacter xiamenensis]SMQ74585.1 peptidyl-prolyl cis-trans isomerase D [Altererythrobacter xiamenensis]